MQCVCCCCPACHKRLPSTPEIPCAHATAAPAKCSYDFQQSPATRLTGSLQASWDNFTDPHSGVTGYSVQFFQQVLSALPHAMLAGMHVLPAL